jgi:Protein of unknown function (DUF2846)
LRRPVLGLKNWPVNKRRISCLSLERALTSEVKPHNRAAGVVASTILMALLLSAGCVTHPPPSLVQPWPKPPQEHSALLMMYCDHGGARGPSIFVDNELTFKFRGDCYMWTYVPAGKHTLRTKWVWLFSGLNKEIPMELESGKSYYLKLLVGSDNNPFYTTVRAGIVSVPEEIAESEAKKCWFRKTELLK